MSFEKLIGNDDVKEILNNIIKNNKLTHSYMFIGPSRNREISFCKRICKNDIMPRRKHKTM